MFDPRLLSLGLDNPNVLIGMLLGGMLPFIFAALTMNAVGRSANKMIEEVRRQFREIEGLMEGKAEPDSARCVAIATKAAIREMIAPGRLADLSAGRGEPRQEVTRLEHVPCVMKGGDVGKQP